MAQLTQYLKPNQTYTIALTQPGTVQISCDRPATIKTIVTPGDDVTLMVDAPAPTPPPPTPMPTPPVHSGGSDVEITPGQTIATVIDTARVGSADRPTVVYLRKGRYVGGINPPSHIRLIGEAGVVVSGRLRLSSGSRNIHVINIAFQGTREQDYGLDSVFSGVGPADVLVDRCGFDGFGGGIRMQHANSSDLAKYARNIAIRRTRLTHMSATGDHEGHGAFLQNCWGVLLEENFIDGAGAAGTIREIWVHGVYSKEGNRDVVLRRNWVENAESFGLQARGTTRRQDDSVTLPGPIVDQNVIVNACNGICLDGNNALATNNLIGVRYFHNKARGHINGWAGIYASVGSLRQGGNIRFRSPGKSNIDGYKDSAWRNDIRKDDVWCRQQGPCRTISTGEPDIDAVNNEVDLSDLTEAIRAGSDIGAAVNLAQARVRGK